MFPNRSAKPRLGHKRIRIHRALHRLESLVAGYHAKLARVEARIKEIAPELRCPAGAARQTRISPEGS